MLLALLTLGCNLGDDPRFPGGGNNWEFPDTADTANTTGDDSGQQQGDGKTPVINDVMAGFCVYPNIGNVMVFYIDFDDPDGDIEGGRVLATLDGSTLKDTNGVEGFKVGAEGGQLQAFVIAEGDYAGQIFFAITSDELKTSQTYEMDLILRDKSKHESEPWLETVSGKLADADCSNFGG